MKKYQKPETVNVNIEGADLMTESVTSMVGNPGQKDPEQGIGTAPRKVI